jgi:hypothetical protein
MNRKYQFSKEPIEIPVRCLVKGVTGHVSVQYWRDAEMSVRSGLSTALRHMGSHETEEQARRRVGW